jgi:hypothetical protein
LRFGRVAGNAIVVVTLDDDSIVAVAVEAVTVAVEAVTVAVEAVAVAVEAVAVATEDVAVSEEDVGDVAVAVATGADIAVAFFSLGFWQLATIKTLTEPITNNFFI